MRARLLNFVLQVKKRRVCYWANPQMHTHTHTYVYTYTSAGVYNERVQTSSNGRLYEREKYTL